MPPLYSNPGYMTGMWNPLQTDAHPLDLMFRHQCLALSRLLLYGPPCRSTELWGESGVTIANMSFIYQLPKNLISSQTQYTVVSQVFAFF